MKLVIDNTKKQKLDQLESIESKVNKAFSNLEETKKTVIEMLEKTKKKSK